MLKLTMLKMTCHSGLTGHKRKVFFFFFAFVFVFFCFVFCFVLFFVFCILFLFFCCCCCYCCCCCWIFFSWITKYLSAGKTIGQKGLVCLFPNIVLKKVTFKSMSNFRLFCETLILFFSISAELGRSDGFVYDI